MITLRNKTVAHNFLASFDNANGRLCQEDCCDPEIFLPWSPDVTLFLSIGGYGGSHAQVAPLARRSKWRACSQAIE